MPFEVVLPFLRNKRPIREGEELLFYQAAAAPKKAKTEAPKPKALAVPKLLSQQRGAKGSVSAAAGESWGLAI